MKQAQISARLKDLRRRIVQSLSPHYVVTDNEKRLDERTAVAERVIADFDECVNRQTFGAFLRGLCLDRVRLADALYEIRTRGAPERDDKRDGHAPAPVPARSSLLDLVKAGGRGSAKPSAPLPSRSRSSRSDLMARCALEVWSNSLHETSDDEEFASSLGVSCRSLKEVAIELIATSRRLTLEDTIRISLDEISHIETAEQAAAKATIVAERHVNRLVTTLRNEPEPRRITFDAGGIGSMPVNFQQDYAVRWMTAFYENARANALSADGLVHDPEQNALLGQIISRMQVAI
jgi:hypothetical protein